MACWCTNLSQSLYFAYENMVIKFVPPVKWGVFNIYINKLSVAWCKCKHEWNGYHFVYSLIDKSLLFITENEQFQWSKLQPKNNQLETRTCHDHNTINKKNTKFIVHLLSASADKTETEFVSFVVSDHSSFVVFNFWIAFGRKTISFLCSSHSHSFRYRLLIHSLFTKYVNIQTGLTISRQ